MASNIKIARDASPWGDRLSLAEAAGFLRMGVSTLQKKVALGLGPQAEEFNGRLEFEIPELIRWRQSTTRKR
jgi:hypothetical protein